MEPFQLLSRRDRPIHEDRRHFLAGFLKVAFQDLDGEFFLRLEVVVEVGRRHPGGLEDFVDARGLVSIPTKDGRRGFQELFSITHTR